jgi:hypothetical protein
MPAEKTEVQTECFHDGEDLTVSVTLPLTVLDAADKQALYAQAKPYTAAVWQELVAAWKARQSE